MTDFITKDSGKQQAFDSGAVRDTHEGKPRYDLIPPKALKRVADLYARGADKYGEYNWAKGVPTSRFLASLCRHLEQFRDGDSPEEDHLAAIVFNAMGIMHFQSTDWDDTYDWNQTKTSDTNLGTQEYVELIKTAQAGYAQPKETITIDQFAGWGYDHRD